MARLTRVFLPDTPLHIIQRGNNRQACFAADEDFSAYAHWLEKYARKYHVLIHAWVFMTNHVHLLVTPETVDGVSRLMQSLGRHYVRYFNHSYQRTGTLWEGRFKSCLVDADSYLLLCQRYIELNPVRACMVECPAEYKWSSFLVNGLAQRAAMWTPHRIYSELGRTHEECSKIYRSLFDGHIVKALLTQIRQSTNKGMALGNQRFKQEIERLSGRRVTELKRGPKKKGSDET